MGPKLQAECKARFVHRFTGEHKPKWAHKPFKNESLRLTAYPVQFADDTDWLANTYFEVTKQGELDRRTGHCESYPTWPLNPELRKA